MKLAYRAEIIVELEITAVVRHFQRKHAQSEILMRCYALVEPERRQILKVASKKLKIRSYAEL